MDFSAKPLGGYGDRLSPNAHTSKDAKHQYIIYLITDGRKFPSMCKTSHSAKLFVSRLQLAREDPNLEFQ